jgi:nuclear cap-binding protein subunit 2
MFTDKHYSRGKSGGQVRDEYRDEYDPGRGGFGRAFEERDRDRILNDRY